MPALASLVRRYLIGLLVPLMLASSAFAGEYLCNYCLDVESDTTTVRLFELAVTSIGEGQYLLNGTRVDLDAQTPGAAFGNAALIGDTLIFTINSSHSISGGMNQTDWNVELSLPNLTGSYQSISQDYAGSFEPRTYSSGTAALVDCTTPVAAQ